MAPLLLFILSMCRIGIIVGYGIWPQLYSSFGPEGRAMSVPWARGAARVLQPRQAHGDQRFDAGPQASLPQGMPAHHVILLDANSIQNNSLLGYLEWRWTII